ncbi:MFS transporter [Saccharopolyspora halophila]|uniref:MFS transporter n=1 Tax=Saccharopolyspora halophila TaxID=405551 RepID=A0ABN3GZZ6_9PSEU
MHSASDRAAALSSASPVAPSRAHLPRVVIAASIALALTAPGQTAAMSVFIDPLIRDLGISRTVVSTAYMCGSLAGAVLMPFLGRLIDRYGPRRVMIAVGACFAAVLVVSATVTELFGLTAAFIGLRVGGQGALNLVATTTVAIYVHRRRGFAIGLSSAIGTAGISLAPVLLERLIADLGWRDVWVIEGVVVLCLVVPAALFLLPRTPPAPPREPADEVAPKHAAGLPEVDWTLREALRTGMFWTVAGGVGACSLVGTALTFHLVSLLGERGLSPAEAAATFVPQTLAGLVASFALGWAADHIGDRSLIIGTMLVLAAATAGAGWVQPGWTAVAYRLALGTCMNGVRTLEAVAFPRCFGLKHLGSIRGTVHSMTVGASSLGPLALAVGRSMADGYRPALLALCLLPALVVLAGLIVRHPPPVPPGREIVD